MHLPLWFPFHLSKVSYWSRTVIVPLLVLMALRPRGAQSARRRMSGAVPHAARAGAGLDPRPVPLRLGAVLQRRRFRAARGCSRAFPRRSRAARIDKAVRFVTERLNGDDGLGGIYPAIANSVMMFDTLGYPPDHPDAAIAWRAVRKLLVVEPDRAYCQPCLSPVWDTGLAGHAMAEAGVDTDAACAWLRRAADPRRGRRLVGAAARTAARRLGVPVREPALPRCRRHRRGRHAAAPQRRSGASPRRSRGRASGSSACSRPTAAGARSSRRTRTST